MRTRGAFWIVPALLAVLYLPVVIDDAETYHSVASSDSFCCGFVSENRFERPVTYALVDEWTEPAWTQNAIGSERWLTSDGKVNGVTKFWRIIERQPINTGENGKAQASL